MRLRFGALVCVLVGCGGNSSGSGSKQPPPPASHMLTVQVTGDGKVTSSPGGIDCSAACSGSFSQAVTLTATASANATFAGWGGACSGTGGCVVAMTADTTVTAAFHPNTPPPATAVLSISVDGTGVVTAPDGSQCAARCDVSLAIGTQVSLTATPGAGMSFAGWRGACSGLQSCSFTLAGNASVGARFISGPPPRYGMWLNSTPSWLPSCVIVRWPMLPAPIVP